MISFLLSIAVLILGYFTYGRLVEKVLRPTAAATPAMTMTDGVDYVPLPTWKVFLIQLLNIAGTGPIFGALMGAVFGPIVFLWIVFGCVLGGAVHDYCVGLISLREKGVSVSELTGKYMGNTARLIMRVFSLVLLVLVGTVFVSSPATLINSLTGHSFGHLFWVVVILLYYVLASILPIDKLIGKLYPLFGVVLMLMVLLVGGGILLKGYHIPELTLTNLHPDGQPAWPFMFVTVACGAISGFHATQSPMMARCLKTEKDGRRVFYGAMITEGIIAMVWAAAGVAFYGATGGLQEALRRLGQSGVVYDISTGLLGKTGGLLAIIGVVVCPITSGDTAFRAARLTIADALGMEQMSLRKRLLIAVPLLSVGAVLTQVDFNIIWRYFSWSNQTLAMIALWMSAVYLLRERGLVPSFLAAVPAAFMSAVSATYILIANEGFRLPARIAWPAGVVFAALCCGLYAAACIRAARRD